MSRVIELTQELKKELDSLPLFQEYKRIKELVDNSKELKSLKAEIVKSSNDKDKHKELLDRYNNHPLVVNLQELESEVSDYLREICEIINKK